MFFPHICYLIRSAKFSISLSVLFFAFWTWNALLVLLVGNTFKMWVLGNWRDDETRPFLLKRDLIYSALMWKAKLTSLVALQVGTGQHKVWDPLWGTCLCQSLLWVLGESQPPLAGCLWRGFFFHERENTFHLRLMSKSPSTTWKTMVPEA